MIKAIEYFVVILPEALECRQEDKAGGCCTKDIELLQIGAGVIKHTRLFSSGRIMNHHQWQEWNTTLGATAKGTTTKGSG